MTFVIRRKAQTSEYGGVLRRLADIGFDLPPEVPDAEDRTLVHDVIYDELCQGLISADSKRGYMDVVVRARRDSGADGVIFGCTEVGLLVGQDDFDIPVFDTTELHARAALDFALG